MSTDLSFVQHEVHRRLLAEILERACRDGDVTGVLLKGSVARGDAYPRSDLDIQILLRDGCRRPFHAQEREGILVECGYADDARARDRIARDPMWVYAYLDGRILHDPQGHLAALVRVARARCDAYRVSAGEKRAIAHWLKSARLKIVAARNAGDELRATYVASTSSWEILKGLWAVHDKPMPPAGAVWAHIRDLSLGPPDISAWLERLFAGRAPDRIRAAVEIIDWVLPILEKTQE